ncbi:MAG: hypothetical protein KKF27_21345, partial [Gammaproteobacteria bacterium]|nr:hypothetical protein [Gammaproteobacteria bacterium]
ITIPRGDTLSLSLTDLGSVADYVTLDFMVKESKSDADADALIWIRLNEPSANDGLLYLNGAAATTAADGSITVDDAATGDITIALIAADTAALSVLRGGYWEVQKISATAVTTMTAGPANISLDVIKAVE